MALLYLSVPVSPDGVTVSRHEQYQQPESEAATWNSAISNLIIYTCAFPTETCQNVFCGKHLLCTLATLRSLKITRALQLN